MQNETPEQKRRREFAYCFVMGYMLAYDRLAEKVGMVNVHTGMPMQIGPDFDIPGLDDNVLSGIVDTLIAEIDSEAS